MPHKFDPSHRGRLCSAERLRRLPPERILRQAGLKPGDTVVDLGCGTGFFALPAARLVGPQGRVFGLDVSPEMVHDLKRAAGRDKLKNIEAVLSSEDGTGIPASASLYFMANVFHELSDRKAYLRNLRRAMAPHSRLAILDYHRRRTEHGPPLEDRVSVREASALLRRSGFAVQKTWQVNPEEYGLVARPKRKA